MTAELNVDKEEEEDGPSPLSSAPTPSAHATLPPTPPETPPALFEVDASPGVKETSLKKARFEPNFSEAAPSTLLDRKDKTRDDDDEARTASGSSESAYTAAYSRTVTTDYGIYARRMALSDASSDRGGSKDRASRLSTPSFHALPKHKYKPTFLRPTPKRHRLSSQYAEPLMLRCILVEPTLKLPTHQPSLYLNPPRVPTAAPITWAITIHVHPTASISCLAQKIIDLNLPYLSSREVVNHAQLLLWKATPPIEALFSKHYTSKVAKLKPNKERHEEMLDRPRAVALPPHKAVGQFLWDIDANLTNRIDFLAQCFSPLLQQQVSPSMPLPRST